MRISDWSSDVCASDLSVIRLRSHAPNFVESDAHAVPASPHTAALRIASVAFATPRTPPLTAARWLNGDWPCTNPTNLHSVFPPPPPLSPPLCPHHSSNSTRQSSVFGKNVVVTFTLWGLSYLT